MRNVSGHLCPSSEAYRVLLRRIFLNVDTTWEYKELDYITLQSAGRQVHRRQVRNDVEAPGNVISPRQVHCKRWGGRESGV